MICGYIWWSIYVRTKTHRKLLETHLPLIEQAIGETPFGREIGVEDENPGLIRAVTYQNLEARMMDEIVSTVVLRAACLANAWTFSGFDDLNIGELRQMSGWSNSLPKSQPPAIDSILFEIRPGRIKGRAEDVGWLVEGGEDVTLQP